MWSYLCAALSIGVVFSAQPAINASVARVLGAPLLTAALSIFISLACIVALFPLFGSVSLRTVPFASTPPWILLAGLAGALVVFGGLAITPVTGAAVFFVLLITGQLLGAAVLDHLGAFGLPRRPITLTRAAGLLCLVAGVYLVRRS